MSKDIISGDIRDNALQLSHFVYANDGEFIQTAVQVDQSSGSDWYTADQAMQKAFRTAMVPSQDILVGAFYMDGTGAVYMKDEVAIPEGQVRDTDWSVVTFVEESSLGQRFYQVGGILALIVTALMILFYFYSRYFLNAIIDPVQEVCRGMERLDQNDLEVRLEPKGQRELQDLMTSLRSISVPGLPGSVAVLSLTISTIYVSNGPRSC